MIRLKCHKTPNFGANYRKCLCIKSRLITIPNRRIASNVLSDDSSRRSMSSERAIKSRITQAAEIIRNENSFQRTSVKLRKLYARGSEIFEDLRAHPKRTSHLARELCRGFTQSSSMRGFYLEQLYLCLMNNELRAFATGVKILEELGFLSVYERILIMEIESDLPDYREKSNTQKNMSHEIKSKILELLIYISATSGEPLVAASFLLRGWELSVNIKAETITRVISALSVSDALMGNYHSFAIFKILKTIEKIEDIDMILNAIHNMSFNETPYFANMLHDSFQQRYKERRISPESLVKTRKALLVANLKHGNPYRAATLWSLIQNSDPKFADKNVILFSSIAAKIAHNDPAMDKLLASLPRSLYTDPDLVDFLLSYFGRRSNHRSKFEYVAKSLKPPLSRNSLSSLFASFIAQNKEDAAEKILQVMFKTKNGINSSDFLVIITKLLATHQIKQCVDMCAQNDFRVSYKGAIKVLEFLLASVELRNARTLEKQEVSDALKNSFLKKLVRDLHRKTNRKSVYRLLTTAVFRHLSAHINNRAARKLYSNLSYMINKAGNNFSKNSSLSIPQELVQFLRIDKKNRMTCLETILRQAEKEQDQLVINWCASELQSAGIPIADIEKFFMNGASK